MHKKVREFLIECNKKEKNERDEFLISIGLCEKEYSPTNQYSETYSCSEYDEESKTFRYYKPIPVEVSDEEYAIIKKCYKKFKPVEKNGVGKALLVIAIIIYVFSFVAGFIWLADYEIAFGIICWISGFVSGTIFLGFAEIIKLLTEIKNK